MKDFLECGLRPDLVEMVESMGWAKPTEVQGLCLPFSLSGRDVAGFAQTGTGKTGVFLLTILQKLLSAPAAQKSPASSPRAIVLLPTRELAMQVSTDASELFIKKNLRVEAIFGGVDMQKQEQLLRTADIIMATPGRLMDFYKRRILSFDSCEIFVCDEGDRMFEMGFIEDVEVFFDKIPENCQRMIFSATTNDEVKELAFEFLNNPEYISVTPDEITPERIEQHAIVCETRQKLAVLIGLLKDQNPNCSIIFVNTKMSAEWLQHKLSGNGFDVEIITGDLPQRKRISLIARIKEGKIKALIATDVASRGLHIAGVTHVFNFDVPEEASNYVHRIGRTARAGAKGSSYTLVCEDYGDNWREITTMLGPNVTPAAEWFDPKYLEFKDLASNPSFKKDRETGKRRMVTEGQESSDRPEARFDSRRNFNNKPAQKGSRDSRNSSNSKRSDSPRRPQQNDRPRRNDFEQKPHKNTQSGSQRGNHLQDNRFRDKQSSRPVAAAAVPHKPATNLPTSLAAKSIWRRLYSWVSGIFSSPKK